MNPPYTTCHTRDKYKSHLHLPVFIHPSALVQGHSHCLTWVYAVNWLYLSTFILYGCKTIYQTSFLSNLFNWACIWNVWEQHYQRLSLHCWLINTQCKKDWIDIGVKGYFMVWPWGHQRIQSMAARSQLTLVNHSLTTVTGLIIVPVRLTTATLKHIHVRVAQ